MKWQRVGILWAVSTVAGLAIGRAQAPPGDAKAGMVTIDASQAPARTAPNVATKVAYQVIPASDFDPDTACASGCTDYTSTWNPGLGVYDYRRYVTAGQPRLFASPRLPDLALLNDVQYSYCDNNGSGRLSFNIYICNNLGQCSSTPYHTHTSTAGSGCVTIGRNLSPYRVDNVSSKILVEVGWGVSDDTLQLAGVTFGYLQPVSLPPSTPTFNDVPTSDPGFQYIEALFASGITAGCGGGNFCPDSPLTRRQMAVFLAKALGL